MNRSDNLRTRLQRGDVLIGTMLTVPSPEIAELLAEIGFDWIFIDGEHGPFGASELRSVLQAVGDRSDCLVRVPAIDESPIKRALDLGAAGIIVPQVNSASEAADVVSWCRYPPTGQRGIGLARAHRYGVQSREYVERANEEVAVVIQAENRRAVADIAAIASTPGIDCILVGPNDLAASLDRLGSLDDPIVLTAISQVELACRSAGVPLGIFGATPASAGPYLERGYRLIVVGIDVLMLGQAAEQVLRHMRAWPTSNSAGALPSDVE